MSRDLHKAIDTCVEYLTHRVEVRTQLQTFAGDGVRAQDIAQDRNTGHTVVVDEDDKVGRPIVSDPTSSAAGRGDEMLTLLADLDKEEAKLEAAANRLIGHPLLRDAPNLAAFLRAYRDRYGAPDDWTNRQVESAAKVFQRALNHTVDVNTEPQPGLAADGKAGCGSCARLKVHGRPWWNLPDYNDGSPSDVGGRIDRKLKLCWCCYRFIKDRLRLPSVNELRHRRDDPRGRWPVTHSPAKKAS